MQLDVDGLPVRFPYSRIYPEQRKIMHELKLALDKNQHALLEVPACIGRSVALLAVYVAYRQQHADDVGNLIFACRTVSEVGKVLEILQLVIGANSTLTACGLPSRPMLEAASAASRGVEDGELQLSPGVNSLDTVAEAGARLGLGATCLAMRLVKLADILVCNYHHVLDAKVSQLLFDDAPASSSQAKSRPIVIFDEAHNLDHACIECLSCNFRLPTLNSCRDRLRDLSRIVRQQPSLETLATTRARSIGAIGGYREAELFGAPPTMLGDPNRSFPGNLRRPASFVWYMQRVVEYLHSKLESCQASTLEGCKSFLHEMERAEDDFAKPLRYVGLRLRLLLSSLGEALENRSQFQPLCVVADFLTLIATHEDTSGFGITLIPRDVGAPQTEREPVLQLCCHDASIALKRVLQLSHSVILTSGTLSPLPMWQSLLGLPDNTRICSLPVSFTREALRPMVVTRGTDQVAMRSALPGDSTETEVIRNYGSLLLECASTVPDGVVVYFASYALMQHALAEWSKAPAAAEAPSLLRSVTKHKLLFLESSSHQETAMAVENYKRACDVGRGAVFLSVVRSKVAEAVEFDGHYGRAVIVLGFPFLDLRNRASMARLEWLRDAKGISESDYLSVEAMRQASQVIGRVINRGKTDYGVLLLADRRYAEPKRRAHLPKWIAKFMDRSNEGGSKINLSTDIALKQAKEYLREMAQTVREESCHSANDAVASVPMDVG